MKPSELIKVLQQAIDAGEDDNTKIFFDAEARKFDYHMVDIGSAYYETDECMGYPFISMHEKN